jgi:DNA-binding NarL/FixJ family response regulator
MTSVTSHEWSGARVADAALSLAAIAPDERAARAALAVLERDGLAFEADHLGSGRSGAERLGSDADVVLMIEDGDGLVALVRAARRRAPEAGIVVVVETASRGEARRVLAAGGDALVLEDEMDEVLAVAVRAASLGQISVPRPLRDCVEPPALSYRERQIVALVAAGCTNAQIAARLCLAESTVKAHLSSVFRRLGVSSRRQAVAALLASEGAERGADVALT